MYPPAAENKEGAANRSSRASVRLCGRFEALDEWEERFHRANPQE